ncbi:HlyD family efflux transporter periplasmic adaptor subunit [Leptolyngbyaceae cyanobacterium UHCC 1019]
MTISNNGHLNTGELNGKVNANVEPVPTAQPQSEPCPKVKPKRVFKEERFEHPLMMKQSPFWSRAILWVLMGVTVTGVTWACLAEIEEAIPAQGKLEPRGAVKDVQAPVNGVVKAVYVKDGQQVKRGTLLLRLDPTTVQAQLASLKKIRLTLVQENEFYGAQMRGQATDPRVPIPTQFLSLTRSRSQLVAEDQMFRAQLDGTTGGNALTSDQRERLQSNRVELETRTTAGGLETSQLYQQLQQAQTKLVAAQKTFQINQRLLNNVAPLAKTGAISQVQYLKQEQEVEANRSEVRQLQQEKIRLQFAISQSQTKVENTRAGDRKEGTTKLAENGQKIAEIDSQLSKAILENNRRIAEIDSQLSQTQQTLKYGDLHAPVAGTVFELKAGSPGFVANTTEPILKIVPNDALVAKVSITNQDIGFIREGMTVDVRIDSFPFSEFGDIQGKLIWIGSDALPPTQIQPQYTFPAKIQLQRQSLRVNGREVKLQSGMSLSGNIKIRKRTVMSIFTDQFTKGAEGLKFVR